MRKLILLISCMSITIGIFSQKVSSKSYDLMLNTLLNHSVPEVSVGEVTGKDIVLLDAREMNEFEVSKIKAAQWVGYNDFSLKSVENIPKDEEIVVYCSVGYRSEKVAEKLRKAGYTNVSNLYGGIFEWVNQDQPVVDSTNTATENIHAYDRVWGLWMKKGKKIY